MNPSRYILIGKGPLCAVHVKCAHVHVSEGDRREGGKGKTGVYICVSEREREERAEVCEEQREGGEAVER